MKSTFPSLTPGNSHTSSTPPSSGIPPLDWAPKISRKRLSVDDPPPPSELQLDRFELQTSGTSDQRTIKKALRPKPLVQQNAADNKPPFVLKPATFSIPSEMDRLTQNFSKLGAQQGEKRTRFFVPAALPPHVAQNPGEDESESPSRPSTPEPKDKAAHDNPFMSLFDEKQ